MRTFQPASAKRQAGTIHPSAGCPYRPLGPTLPGNQRERSMSKQPFDYTVADFNYIEHADGPQRLRLFMPVGTGPFPLVVDLHGGAWSNQDLKDCEPRDLTLAKAGFAVAALNFRHAGHGYPSSLVDINYA